MAGNDYVAITATIAAVGVVLNGLATIILQMVKTQTTARVQALEARVKDLQSQLVAANSQSAASAMLVATLAAQLTNETAARQADATAKNEVIKILQAKIDELTAEVIALKVQLATALAALAAKANAPEPEGQAHDT